MFRTTNIFNVLYHNSKFSYIKSKFSDLENNIDIIEICTSFNVENRIKRINMLFDSGIKNIKVGNPTYMIHVPL